MTKEEELYISICENIDNSIKGQMFGKSCFKINGKAFACFFQDSMVFKLTGEMHKEAINLDNVILFDPSGKGRPMKEWVQVPYQHRNLWSKFAYEAAKYIS